MSKPEEINKQQHQTSFYDSNYLIVRRGQEFRVKVTFNRPYKPKEDKFALEFVIGKQRRVHRLLRCASFNLANSPWFTQVPTLTTARAPTFPSSPTRSVNLAGQAASQTPPTKSSPSASLLWQIALWGNITCTLRW